MYWLLAGLAVAAGILLAVQSGVNAALGKALDQPLLAALGSFTIGGTALLLTCIGLRLPLPTREQLSAPWWVWTGGLLGAFFVVGQAMLPPRLGLTVYLVLVIAGQLVTALVLDHFGMIGLKEQPITAWRLLGVVFLVAAVALIRGG
jgi:transporter family-2 protein